jgi:hypothetical protein
MAKVGEKRRNGAVSFTVVAVDKKFVYVKRSDVPKRELAEREGAHTVSLAEFANWTE